MCPRCAELEKALEGAIYVTDAETRMLCRVLRLSPSEARILMLLYKARGVPLTVEELDTGLPAGRGSQALRVDPEFRTMKTITLHIHRMRKQLGPDVIGTTYATGYWLGGRGKTLVDAAVLIDAVVGL